MMTSKNRYLISRAAKSVLLALALVLMAALAACSDDSGTAVATPKTVATPKVEPTVATSEEPEPEGRDLLVVTTTNIVADWVENIAGDNVEVFSLLPVGADPHGYQPGARDVARVADADLVLSVGLGLEESWLRELLQNAARDPSTIVELGELIDPIEFGETHIEDVELLEGVAHAIEEVEAGEISPEEALEEIRELLEALEEGEHHGDEGAEDEGHMDEEAGDEGHMDEEAGDEDHMDEDEGEDHAEADEDEGDDHGDEEGEEEHEEEHGDELVEMVEAVLEEFDEGHIGADEAVEVLEALSHEGEEEHEGHGHGIHDPHFWFDPIRVKLAVDDIAERLSALDPDRRDTYVANASAYGAELDELHTWTQQQLAGVPQANRLLVTSHDSLGYFANLYDFEVIGVILSITTEAEPSPEDLAHLVEEVREYQVPAVFGETTVSDRLAQAVAAESGAEFVRLYSGSLGGDGSGAATYIGMVRANVERIAEALN